MASSQRHHYIYEGARIDLILGPMWAGKTTELMRRRRVQNVKIDLNYLVLLKAKMDDRYESNPQHRRHPTSDEEDFTDASPEEVGPSKVFTHWGNTAAAFELKELMSFTKTKEFVTGRIFYIDEGQFFPDLLEFCMFCMSLGKSCAISALNGDFTQKSFPSIQDIYSHCSDVTFLHGVCMACDDGISAFTVLKEGVQTPDGQIHVGGNEAYQAVCARCLNARQTKGMHDRRCETPVNNNALTYVYPTTPSPDYGNGRTRPTMPDTPIGAKVGRARRTLFCHHDLSYPTSEPQQIEQSQPPRLPSPLQECSTNMSI